MKRVAALGLVLATMAGCGPTIFDLPRPGGSVASPSYEVTARFADALNLPDGAHVRVGGVDVGRVEKISTHNFVADGISVHNSLEQDADIVVLLHREDMHEPESPRAGEADLIVAKHRNGPCATVTVAFQGHYSRFVDMAPG